MINKTYTPIIIIALIFIHTNLFSQFLGGNADGYGTDSVHYATCTTSLPTYADIYFGGSADGYGTDSVHYSTCTTSLPTYADIYYGGSADGYATDSVHYTVCTTTLPSYADIYFGGNADGYATDSVHYATCTTTLPTYADIYFGGNSVGYDMDKIEYLACIPCTVSVNLGNDTTVCSGSSIYLDVTGIGYSYLWSTGNTTGAINVAPTVTTKYSVTVSDLTCSRVDTITVNISPTAKIAGTTTICNGDSTALTASGGNTYLWSTAATVASITVKPIVNTSYIVTVSDSTCSGTDTASVTVTVTNTSASGAISGTTTICEGKSTTLTASGGSTYSWSTGDSVAATTVSPTSNTDYTVTISNGSCSDTAITTSVTVNANPATPTITQNGNVLTSSASVNEWYLDGNVINGATSSTHTAVATGNYYVIVTNADGCTAQSATASVVVGIDEADFTHNTFAVYPNPHNGIFSLSFNVNAKDNYTIEITNVLGQVVYHEPLNSFSGAYKNVINMSQQDGGIYMLWLKTSDDNAIRKTIVQNR